jgi:hypothetical protein
MAMLHRSNGQNSSIPTMKHLEPNVNLKTITKILGASQKIMTKTPQVPILLRDSLRSEFTMPKYKRIYKML